MLKTRQSNDSEKNKISKNGVDSRLQLINNATCMAKKKADQLAVRPTPEDWKLVEALRAKTGLANASLIRLALRRLAEAEGLKVA